MPLPPQTPYTNLFARPPAHPLIAPSVLSADFGHIAAECTGILAAGADLLHLDVMDGHFVPNLTMGPDMCHALRKALPNAFLDVHLMVTEPAQYVDAFAKAGANHLTFHIEVIKGPAVSALANRIRSLGLSAGLAINPPTPVAAILPHLAEVDLILVMSVNPGYSGQSFIAPVLDKTRTVKARLTPSQRLEMDGGINPTTAPAVREAGCDVIVGGSAIFGVPAAQRRDSISALRGS